MAKPDVELTNPPILARTQYPGPVRTRRPAYVDLLPPCNAACPAGENIQAWLAEAQAGRFEAAWRILVQDNPLPAVHGRVCYHPCEGSCNRSELDSAISIHAVERYLGDLALQEKWRLPPVEDRSGKRVLVVGAGPSGLSAAHHLQRLGHEVEIREAGPVAGGMMNFGIPSYRLPRDILAAEIGRIESAGVKITLNHKIEDLLGEMQAGAFDAVFVAIGAHLAKRVDIPARDAGRILDAVDFLKDADGDVRPKLGRRVAIYGGGNTAMDAARVAKRLGHEPLIIYRRDRDHMPAHAFEADEAVEEGVKIHWLRSIRGIEGSNVAVETMALDENGRPHPTGEVEVLEADSLILALGQNVDADFLRRVPGLVVADDGIVQVDGDMMTGHAGIFAGGDMVPAERTVTTAVGHGKKAARHIDGWLSGAPYVAPEEYPVVGFERLHVWYFTEAPQGQQARLDLPRRRDSFDEVLKGFNAAEATFEAQRCLSCGNCYECDGCYGACPERAIIKMGPGKGYSVALERCTGCAVCFEQCPCYAIEMVPEPAGAES